MAGTRPAMTALPILNPGPTAKALRGRHFLAPRRNPGYDLRDEQLDRRELRDRADEPYDRAQWARVLQPERVPARGAKIFIPIRRNPLKSHDWENKR
jgi:hypothetical protein